MTERTMGDPVPLIQNLIRCPSVTPDPAGVFDVLQPVLEQLGFTVYRQVFSGDGSYPVENLFATRGIPGKHLLFAGHTDVVPPGERASWSYDPFCGEIIGDDVFGRGAVDMKSGIAAFVAAIERLAGEGAVESGAISLAITNDEEADSINGTEKLLGWAHAEGHRFDFAIVGEPSSESRVGDSIKIGRRGSLNARIAVSGFQGHVAYPEQARNPLPVLASVVQRLSTTPIDTGTGSFLPSNLEFTSIDVGNEVTNIIPAAATAQLNIRFNDQWTPETIRKWVSAQLRIVDMQGCTITIENVGRASLAFLSPQDATIDLLGATIEDIAGIRPKLSTAGGTSDARFVAPYCPVVECGLRGAGMHQVDERVRLADVEQLTVLYAAFMRSYFR